MSTATAPRRRKRGRQGTGYTAWFRQFLTANPTYITMTDNAPILNQFQAAHPGVTVTDAIKGQLKSVKSKLGHGGTTTRSNGSTALSRTPPRRTMGSGTGFTPPTNPDLALLRNLQIDLDAMVTKLLNAGAPPTVMGPLEQARNGFAGAGV